MASDGRGRSGGRGREFEHLARLRASLADLARPGEVHVGDDAAVLLPAAGRLLCSTDLLVEGVHVDLSISSAADVGWKAVAVNVSDIAAMGGIATHLVAAVGAPAGADLDGLMEGVREAADHYGVALVGGDLSGAPVLVVSMTVLGETGDLDPVTRSGARAGDELWCTGPLGGSAAGLQRARAGGPPGPVTEALVAAYRRPLARPAEGRLAARLGATAMIDCSDGLSQDLGHLADESQVGVVLEEVPVCEGATEVDALGGGEDYELLFAAPPGLDVGERFAAEGLRPPLRLGRFVADRSARRLRDGELPALGWSHEIG